MGKDGCVMGITWTETNTGGKTHGIYNADGECAFGVFKVFSMGRNWNEYYLDFVPNKDCQWLFDMPLIQHRYKRAGDALQITQGRNGENKTWARGKAKKLALEVLKELEGHAEAKGA